jgi:hypothetical protein
LPQVKNFTMFQTYGIYFYDQYSNHLSACISDQPTRYKLIIINGGHFLTFSNHIISFYITASRRWNSPTTPRSAARPVLEHSTMSRSAARPVCGTHDDVSQCCTTRSGTPEDVLQGCASRSGRPENVPQGCRSRLGRPEDVLQGCATHSGNTRRCPAGLQSPFVNARRRFHTTIFLLTKY